MDNVVIKIKRKSDSTSFGIGKGYEWKLLKNGLDGFGEFENSLTYVDNGVHDGGLFTSNRMTKCDRTISCAYISPSANTTARRRVKDFFNRNDLFDIYITYMGTTLWAEGTIYKFEINTPENPTDLMKLMITFSFANPYLKSYDDFGQDIASVTPKIGFPYLVSSDVNPAGLTGGVYNFDKDVLLSNDGDVDTFCKAIFTANGEVVNPKLIINSAYVRVVDTMATGDVIVMDFTSFPPTVTKNGVNCIGKCDRTSAFTDMIITKGDTKVAFDADDGDSNLSVSFYYNKLYSAI